ncbi:MAG: 4-(cytidine 5'-diphospho)-2-C-methyl-D-erythritol kinase [Alphaproteobacteria bacterium]|nr:4-(cytidine 5'-diphospho)-2-C-methyl-D-erythritol kinase [Alphaproteobacteria bacterium]
MPPSPLHIFAPAKLNLFLHVTGKRTDGYHTLQSLMVFTDAGDELALSPHDRLQIETEGPFAAQLGNPEDNLVCKAAALLAAHYKISPRGKIRLTKNLPVASGIGGGSADAAAALKGLVKLWNLPEEPAPLLQIAQKLGADVPACLHQKPLWAEGIGEKITPLPELPDLHFVLANPLVPTPTPQVFGNFQHGFSAPIRIFGPQKSTGEWIASLKACRNDLTDAAITVTPAIRGVLAALAATPGCLLHRLSGSGATCFGIYDSAELAQAAASMLKRNHKDWWVTQAGMLR